MPRTLPWLGDGSTKTSKPNRPRPQQSATYSTAKRSTAKRQQAIDVDEEEDVNANAIGPSTSNRRSRLQGRRTPSTSPPPPLPVEEPMREGYSADDIYMMVEDEFMSTAQQFTQHLHRAEYKRLQKQARERERETLEVSKPANGMASFGLLTSDGAAITKPTTKPTTRSDDDEEPWIGDPALAGLMESPRKQQLLLRRGLAPAGTSLERPALTNSGTPDALPARHGASGSGDIATSRDASSPSMKTRGTSNGNDRDDDEGDEDDLDRPYLPQAKDRPAVALSTPLASSSRAQRPNHSIMSQFADQSHASTTRTSIVPDDQDNKSPLRDATSAAAILARRRARVRQKAEKDKSKGDDAMIDEIPMFLF
ncbi:hypothetical protein CAC42_6244 [Sphaceloma murrayae]|uniref:Uncharacterized protein n=1 Tax=Sphaceloma murrayae TaxID=2082308 RepID=A0A2K1QTN4_9PEZI|nr:hypothetical protein CAC42_6244 [Sphaceloma murrayae]